MELLSSRHPFVVRRPLGKDESLEGAARDLLPTRLHDAGAVLFRGFAIGSAAAFDAAVRRVTPELLDYDYASTPRTRRFGRVYTSTEYPAHQRIPLHNEMSYGAHWPSRLWFYCEQPAEEGGATPLADSREVYRRLDRSIVSRFEERKVLYVRNYGTGLDLDWQQAFDTEDPKNVEVYCRQESIAFEWKADGVLKTWQVCQATVDHPVSRARAWFNQAHLFHVSALEPEIRDVLLEVVAEKDLPRNAYYGDGSPIEGGALEEIRGVYEELRVEFAWLAGDVLLLDNVLVAHGRSPFRGSRSVLVAMA